MNISRLSALSVALTFLAATAQAMFMPPELVPVDRLVRSAEAYIEKHREESEAHYTLARIHYLAFSTKRDQVAAFPNRREEGGKPSVAPDWMKGYTRNADGADNAGQTPTPAQLADHAARAARSFNEAVRLDAKNGLALLGLASLLEEFATWRATAKPQGVPAELQGITERRIRDAYSRGFEAAMVQDEKLTHMPVAGLNSITAHEAASAFVRLAAKAGEPLAAEEQKNIQQAQAAIGKFSKLPMGAITPIVFSLHPAVHLAEMLDPRRVVDFDLRGYGTPERWPWVKPTLGFLVWDPAETGSIRSARQMFGGYTFQIFRRNGYDALAALDDDASGFLTGAELAGLSVWFDRDRDGRSAPGEVMPLRDLGVVSIAVTAESRDGIHPTNPRGLTLRDGRTLPTWDWMVEPVPAAAPR